MNYLAVLLWKDESNFKMKGRTTKNSRRIEFVR